MSTKIDIELKLCFDLTFVIILNYKMKYNVIVFSYIFLISLRKILYILVKLAIFLKVEMREIFQTQIMMKKKYFHEPDNDLFWVDS